MDPASGGGVTDSGSGIRCEEPGGQLGSICNPAQLLVLMPSAFMTTRNLTGCRDMKVNVNVWEVR